MKTKIAFGLKKGEIVRHKRYGLSKVENIVPEFGPVIIPSTIYGRLLLKTDSGCPDCPINELWRTAFPYLVTDFKQNLKS